jgi:hypothetical protein
MLLHVRVKVVWDVIAPVTSLPLVGRRPLQPPLAVQEEAPEVVHVRVVVRPDTTDVGFAVRFTVTGEPLGVANTPM